MVQGVQTTLFSSEHPLYKDGCYFFSLMRLCELELKTNFSRTALVNAYEIGMIKGLIGDSCYIKDPARFVEHILDISEGRKKEYTVSMTYSLSPPNLHLIPNLHVPSYIIELRKPGFVHFVVQSDEGQWDPLPPQRETAKAYFPFSYRIFNIQEV